MSRYGLVLFVFATPLATPAAALSRPKHPPASICADRKDCQKACARDDSNACFSLGEKLLARESALEASDPAAASGVFLSACEKGHGRACLELGRLRAYGLGGPIDTEAAAAATREACDRGFEPACAAVAENAFFAFGQRRDTGLAHALAKRADVATRKACAEGDGLVCALLADLADAGLIGGGPAAVHAFRDQTRRLLEPRCERDDGVACLWLSGAEPAASPKATAALRRGCELGVSRACSGAGWALMSGRGIAQDTNQAITHWKAGCEGNDVWACDVLCSRYSAGEGVPKDEPAARAYCEHVIPQLTRACDLGSGVGCVVLARHYRRGLTVRANQDRAAALFAASIEPLRSACQGHEALACSYLAFLYEQGLGVPKDLAARLGAERTECDSGDGASCFTYAERLRSGDLVERSRERAKFYDNEACELGHRAGCAAAAASPTIAQRSPTPPVSCPFGQTAEEGSPNHCCFSRQVWSDKEQRCVGDPSCPDGMTPRDGTCRGEPAPQLATQDDDPPANQAPSTPAPANRSAPTEAVAATIQPAHLEQPATDCSSCANACASLTARCQTSMSACYESAACLCRCQRDHNGCGLSTSSLDQCIAENTAQSTRLTQLQSQSERSERVK
jgi:TPR repeat protein